MAAFGHPTAFLLLGAAFLISYTAAAPATAAEGDLAQTQALDYPNEAGASRCYYNFQHYEEGDRIVTNEPCLNCTCHKRMLMCYLRVCPFTKAVGQDCTVEKRPDQCCPVITCPQVPVDILTSSTTTEASASTAVGHLNTYGCTLEDNTFYPDGVQMPSDPKTPCELCYCIRNHTACVRQECTLNVEGCRPIYQEGVCCPVRYDCEYNELTTTERPSTGGLLLSSTASPLQCRFGETMYNDGELIESDKPCESCYCMRGDIVCAVRSCGEPMAGKDCEALPPPEGECCPTVYQCANGTIPVDALSTESAIIMHPADIQTQSPPKESEPELPTDEATKTDDPASVSEVTSEATQEDHKEQENVESEKPVVEEQETLPEHVESDPLDEQEEDELLGGISPVDDAKPDNSNVATELPSDHTSSPVKETEKETDSEGEKETATAEPVKVEHEESSESHSEPAVESTEPGKVSHDPEQTPVVHVDPEHIRDEQEVGSTSATVSENIEDQGPIQTVGASESENKIDQPETNPLETDTVIPHGGAVPDSEPEASDNADAKPAEAVSDDGVEHHAIPEVEHKPQEETVHTTLDESVKETDNKVPELPESLDQKKDDDMSSPTKDVVSVSDSVTDEHVDTDVKPDSSESLEPSKPEGVEASEDTLKPSAEVESEGVQKEPVPPRKEDAVPEEPRPTQHAEGSMTKAEDSIPTDLSHTHSETEVPDKVEEIESTQNNESPSEADIKPTESLQTEVQTPTKEEEEVHSKLPEIHSDDSVSSQETPENPTDGDEVESESSTVKVEQPDHPTKVEESASSEGETVPNVVVTESEAETPVGNASDGSSKDEAETHVSESAQEGTLVEESSPVGTETPGTNITPENNVAPVESVDEEKPAEQTNEKHDDENKVPETSNVSNDETAVAVDESSTKENEIVGQPEEDLVPIKEQAPSSFEELSPSTEKYIPAVSEQDQTEINEIITEHSDPQPVEKEPMKESHTETAASEESSTDTLVKLGNEGKPEETVNEEETSGSVDSKPVESQSSESEHVPHHDNPELNVFQDDLHDPIELDPTDFDEQLDNSEHHIHNEVPSENEIVDDHHLGHGGSLDHKHPIHLPGPIGVIPGEGDCLVDGKTYTNNSEIPSRSPCHKVCTCMSSILHCQGIDCPPPPPQLANCMPVHQGDLCCPVYTCDGNTHESPETDNQVVGSDKTPVPVVPEEKPEPSGESEVEQPHEVVTEQQPHEVAPEQPDEVVPEQPNEVAPEKPVEVAPEQPEEVAPEQPAEVVTEQPSEVAPEQPDEVAPEQPVEVVTEKPSEVAPEKPDEVAPEQPIEVATEQPYEVASKQPESPASTTDKETQNTPVEASEQMVEGGDKHQDESSQPEISEEISSEQDPTKDEGETSTNAVEASESGVEESNKEESTPESVEDKIPLVVDNEEQSPTKTNVETEVQTASPEDSAVVGDEKLETLPGLDSNNLPSEGSVESQPAILTDEVENQEAEHEQPLSTDSPVGQEEEPSKPEAEIIVPEQEGESHAEEGEEHSAGGTESPAVPAADVVDENLSDVAEEQIIVTELPTAQPAGVDSAASVFEQVPPTENDNDIVKHPVEEPVKETVETHDKPSQSSTEEQEKPTDDSANDDGSPGEIDHNDVVQEVESHTEGVSLSEDNLPKHPEESTVSVTDSPVKDNTSLESDDAVSNPVDQSPESVESFNEVIKEDETATVTQEVSEISVAEGSDESVKSPESETASIENNNENPSVTENTKESEEDKTNLQLGSEDNKHIDEPSVLEGVNDAVTDGNQEAEISESSTEVSHEPEKSETVPSEETHQEGTEIPVQGSENETPTAAISDNDSTQEQLADTVGTENDNSENSVAPDEVHTDSSVEAEKIPLAEVPSSEAQLNTIVPESAEEQVTTVVYKDHEENFESSETLSEPVDEQHEISPESNTGDVNTVNENEEHSPQPIEPESSGHLEPEATEIAVTEAAAPNKEAENHSDTSSHQSEPEHEAEHPSIGVGLEQMSHADETGIADKDSEQTVKPEQEGQSSEGEEHVLTEEISETTHEETKPELEGDQKEPISHSEVPSGSEEATHHEDEHSTQSVVEPHRPEHPGQESENNVQEPEHPIHEAELQESILPHLPMGGEEEESKPSLPIDPDLPTEDQFPTGAGDMDYDGNEDGAFGPGTCRYGGKVYVSAQQIPRDDPCDFCFCFRSDIICLQQSCPPPIHRCHQEPIQGYCCPRYQCPVSMATSLNLTTTTTTTTTTVPPHFFAHAYQGAARKGGCLHRGRAYNVGDEIASESGPCLHCICGSDGQMKCDPVVCSPEPMLRKMMEAAASHRRR